MRHRARYCHGKLSVTLISWSHRLEFFENNFTVSSLGVFELRMNMTLQTFQHKLKPYLFSSSNCSGTSATLTGAAVIDTVSAAQSKILWITYYGYHTANLHWLLLVQEIGTVRERNNCLILLASPTMRLWTLIMDFAWLTICFISYFAFGHYCLFSSFCCLHKFVLCGVNKSWLY